jgi:hypothetical protein
LKVYVSIVVFSVIILIFSYADANPLVLTDADIEILPKYLWVGAAVILLFEALGVATTLSIKWTKFWSSFAILIIINFIVFTIFSKWLIIVGRYDLDLNLSAFFAEIGVVIVETFCIYSMLRTDRFLKVDKKPHNIEGAIASFFLSLCSNSISAFVGLLYSFWAYRHLYDLRMGF